VDKEGGQKAGQTEEVVRPAAWFITKVQLPNAEIRSAMTKISAG